MGRFVYDSDLTVTLDDDVLAHLQAVVGAKFRLQQPFYLSWRHPAHTGENRTTVWLAPSIPVQFTYRSAQPTALDRERINALLAQANSASGLLLVIDP